jgi:hypothetical protein
LVGENWLEYGGAVIPDDRVVEVSEAEAAALLRDHGSARSVEVLGWVDDHAQSEDKGGND